MAYPTTAALVAESNVDELTGMDPAEQDLLRELAIAAIEDFTGQEFLPTVGDLVMDGGGGREVFPPKRVEALTGVVVKGTDIDLSDVVVDPVGNRIHFLPLSASYAVQAMRESSFDTRTFRAGSGTVVLTGTFGWTTVPRLVAIALRKEMEAQARADKSGLSGIVASARALGLRDVSQGNLRVSLGDPSRLSPDAARLLGKFVWTGPGGHLA